MHKAPAVALISPVVDLDSISDALLVQALGLVLEPGSALHSAGLDLVSSPAPAPDTLLVLGQGPLPMVSPLKDVASSISMARPVDRALDSSPIHAPASLMDGGLVPLCATTPRESDLMIIVGLKDCHVASSVSSEDSQYDAAKVEEEWIVVKGKKPKPFVPPLDKHLRFGKGGSKSKCKS